MSRPYPSILDSRKTLIAGWLRLRYTTLSIFYGDTFKALTHLSLLGEADNSSGFFRVWMWETEKQPACVTLWVWLHYEVCVCVRSFVRSRPSCVGYVRRCLSMRPERESCDGRSSRTENSWKDWDRAETLKDRPCYRDWTSRRNYCTPSAQRRKVGLDPIDSLIHWLRANF